MKSRQDFNTLSEYNDYLRAYFSGLAMQGLLANNLIIGHGSDEIQWVAKHAISQADELLKALESDQ